MSRLSKRGRNEYIEQEKEQQKSMSLTRCHMGRMDQLLNAWEGDKKLRS
jgi:hypothetical protein